MTISESRPADAAPADQNGKRESIVVIRPRDPIVARDARPFAAEPGARAFTLPWPVPRTMAGAIRTFIGNSLGGAWDHALAKHVHETGVHGPLLIGRDKPDDDWEVYVHAPRDVIFYEPDGANGTLQPMVLRPRPLAKGAGVSYPKPPDHVAAGSGYRNARRRSADDFMLPLTVTADVKPASAPQWWRLRDAMRWLRDLSNEPAAAEFLIEGPDEAKGKRSQWVRGLDPLPRDTRVHVGIEPEKQTHKDGALFATESLAFPDGYREHEEQSGPASLAILLKVRSPDDWTGDDAVLPLGGERRPSLLSTSDPHATWPQPPALPEGFDLSAVRGLRLQLVTPAIFDHGWLPDWLGHEGVIPGLKGLKFKVKLRGAAIDRRIPISGWSTHQVDREFVDPQGNRQIRRIERGPRATRYAVPAGSVYFFEIDEGSALTKEILEKLWLLPISDNASDRNDGFGLALPGFWTPPVNANNAGGN